MTVGARFFPVSLTARFAFLPFTLAAMTWEKC